MPTSEWPEKDHWARWQPDNLFSDTPHIPFTPPAAPHPTTSAHELIDVELQQLRQHAQQQGFSDGQRRGREEGHAQGYDAGFQEGQKAGLSEGIAQAQATQQALGAQANALLNHFQATLDQINQLIPARLLQHALFAARQIIGDTLSANPTLLIEQLKRNLTEDRWLQQDAQLLIHPQDEAWVREFIADACQALHWEIRSDENMLPGGCKLIYADGELDATLERRWQSLCQLSREDFS